MYLKQKQSYDSALKAINQLSPQKISTDFDIWVFYTDKNYLTELEDGSLGTKTAIYKRSSKALFNHPGWKGYFRPKNYRLWNSINYSF